jgi:hypothetical protein
VRPPDPQPEIYLEGPAQRKSYAALESQLAARVSIPACLSLRNVSVSKSWTILKGFSPTLPNPWFGQTYFLPPSSLTPGMEHSFVFTASASAGGYTVSRSINVTVDALFSPVLAYSSGDGGLISPSQVVEFQVTLVDPDSTSTVPALVWDISCQPPSGNDTPPAEPLPVPNFITPYQFPRFYCDCITFAFGKAQNLPARSYTALAVGSKDSRSFQLAIRANITSDPSESYLRIRLIPRWRSTKPSARERIAVSATVDGFGVLDPNLFRSKWNLFTNSSRELDYLISSDFVTTPLDGSSLGIAFRPESFNSGQSYTLQLSIYDVATSQLRGRNWIDFETNTAPSGGNVSFSRSYALQFQTISVWFSGWFDEDEPLRYSVSLVLDSPEESEFGTDEIVLTDLVDVEKVDVTMTIPGNYTLRARVIDSLGSDIYVDQRVLVSATASTADSVDDLISLLHIGDLRRASAFLSMLSNSSDAASRAAIAPALQSFVSQTRLTANNAILVLKMLKRLSIGEKDSVSLRLAGIDLLCDVVEAVLNSSSFGSSSFPLLSAQSAQGQKSLEDFLSVISNILASFQKNIRPLLKTRQAARLVVSSFQVVQVISRVSMLNENLPNASSTIFQAASVVRCGDVPTLLRLNDARATISSNLLRNCTSGRGVAFDGIGFAGGAFPSPFFYNATNHTLPRVPSIAPVISVGVRSFDPAPANSWNVSVVFSNVSLPIGGPSTTSQAPTCVLFDLASQNWVSSGCVLVPSGVELTCHCVVPAAAGTPTQSSSSQPSQTVLLSIAFGPFTNEPGDLLASPGQDTLRDEAAALAVGAIVGIIVAAVVSAAIISSLIVYRVCFKPNKDSFNDLEHLTPLKTSAQEPTDADALTQYAAIGSRTAILSGQTSVATIPAADVTLMNKLGEGAYGSVWLGRLSDGSFVAVKKLSNGSQTVQIREFFAEASIMSQVNESRHIVHLNGIIAEDGDFGIVMEFCPGGSLDTYSQQIALTQAAFPGNMLFDFVYGIACGMRDLAALQIVHRVRYQLSFRELLRDC